MIKAVKVLKLLWRKIWTLLSTAWTRLLFRVNGVKCGRGLRATGIPSVNVSLGGKAEIGERFHIRTGVSSTEVGTPGTRIRVGRGGRLRIGNRVGMSNATICCEESVEIGNDVMLGGGAQVFDTNFHSTDASERIAGPSVGVRTAPVTIGDRAFVGANAMVCKGVAIGAEAVIAAGSVVVRSVPPGEVWGGNPAIRIK